MSGLAQFLLLGPFFHEGQIVPSPKLYHYLPGTTQEKTAWMDRGKAITAANPIEGDANGLVYGFFSGVYKLVVKTHDGTVTLFQADGVQILDTVDDNVQPTVRPEDHDGEASSSVDNTDPILASLADLPAAGGTMVLGPGDYLFSGTINQRDRHIIYQGAGKGVTFLTLTASSNLLHGIIGTGSITLRDLTLRTQSPRLTDLQMWAVRLDLDGTGISGGRTLSLERVELSGWNAGAYCDGGSAYGIERATIELSTITLGGAATGYVGGGVGLNRCQSAAVLRNHIDQNHTGDHAVYCFGSRELTIVGNRIENADQSEGQGIKVVGNGVSSTQSYDRWTISRNIIDTCCHAILAGTYGTELLRLLEVGQNVAKNIDGSASSVVGDLLTIAPTATSIIEEATVRDNFFSELGSQAIHVTGDGKIRELIVDGVRGAGWSRRSTRTYSLLGTSSNAVVVDKYRAKNIHVDGDGDGRNIWNVNAFGGYGSEDIGSLEYDYDSCSEEGTDPVLGNFIPNIEPSVATPDLRFGRKYILTNPGAQNVTGFESMIPGQEYEFLVTDGNTTLKEGSNLRMAANVDWNPADTDVFKCRAKTATTAVESGRSDNT
ncbi:MAG: hypothetical protein KF766_18100 [Rhodocyclaceae bacterium]|nr:hypothetical protein [Rhodocyclaceae bacterium]